MNRRNHQSTCEGRYLSTAERRWRRKSTGVEGVLEKTVWIEVREREKEAGEQVRPMTVLRERGRSLWQQQHLYLKMPGEQEKRQEPEQTKEWDATCNVFD